jgi:predicted Rossmann fold flavoprotein
MAAAKAVKEQEIWDVAVIGGGAAGMMAAGQAAAKGARVVIIEKNSTLGKKLLITGGGRCNITNAEPKERVFLSKFNSRGKAADQFLFSPFSRHGVKDSIAFFNTQGLQTKVEARERVFPITNLSDSVWDVLVKVMRVGKVHVLSSSGVTKVTSKGNHIEYVTLINDQKIYAHSYIFATGGLSRPDTGSTGDGFKWLTELGHTVTAPDPSLVPLTVRDTWVPALAGVTLPNVTLSLLEDGKKVSSQTGGLLFTHQGISGPAALNLSKEVGERLPYGLVPLSLDLMPGTNLEALDELLLQTIAAGSNKKSRNLLTAIVPSGLVPVVLKFARINEERVANSLTREERITLGTVLKSIPLFAKGRLGFEKAIIASGGVELTEVEMKTMHSRIVDNLYIIGDLLNIDRPSGGYSLQLCWTTGTVAGQSAAETALQK